MSKFLDVLRAIEWAGTAHLTYGAELCCPLCRGLYRSSMKSGGPIKRGHKPGCELDKLITNPPVERTDIITVGRLRRMRELAAGRCGANSAVVGVYEGLMEAIEEDGPLLDPIMLEPPNETHNAHEVADKR